MSVDCDCAGTSAQKPTMKNIGILASNDLLAIDQASCDLVFAAPDGKDVIERIQSRHGLRQLSAMAEKNPEQLSAARDFLEHVYHELAVLPQLWLQKTKL